MQLPFTRMKQALCLAACVRELSDVALERSHGRVTLSDALFRGARALFCDTRYGCMLFARFVHTDVCVALVRVARSSERPVKTLVARHRRSTVHLQIAAFGIELGALHVKRGAVALQGGALTFQGRTLIVQGGVSLARRVRRCRVGRSFFGWHTADVQQVLLQADDHGTDLG